MWITYMFLSTTLTHSEAWGMKKLSAVKYCWCKSEGYNSLFIELVTCASFSLSSCKGYAVTWLWNKTYFLVLPFGQLWHPLLCHGLVAGQSPACLEQRGSEDSSGTVPEVPRHSLCHMPALRCASHQGVGVRVPSSACLSSLPYTEKHSQISVSSTTIHWRTLLSSWIHSFFSLWVHICKQKNNYP